MTKNLNKQLSIGLFAISLLISEGALANSPAVQMNIGSKGFIVNNNGSGDQKFYFSTIQDKPTQSKRDPLFIKYERFLVATNPTELDVSEVNLLQWYGDKEPFLTVNIKNISKLPAGKINIGLYAPLEGNQKTSKELLLTKSSAIKNIDIGSKSTLVIEQNSELKLPIGAISEILQTLSLSSLKDYEFLGVGLSSDIPQSVTEPFIKKYTKTDSNGFPSESTTFTTRPLGIFLKYQTIFDQKRVKPFPVYFYFGKDLNPC